MKLISLALAGAMAASVAGASFAQPAPGAAPGPEGRAWTRPDPAQMAERHAERLRALLQLRPDQEPALGAFIAAMQPSPDRMQRRPAERAEELPTPQRLDRMQARMAERQAEFGRRAEAIKRFYAQLNPAQQRAFDALPLGGHGMHEHMRHGPFGPGRAPGMG